MGRMKRRSRQEEVGVQMEYLQGLHQKHEDWLRFPPASAAGEWRNPNGVSLVDTLRGAEHSLSVRAVPEPKAIQGKVWTKHAFFAEQHQYLSSPPLLSHIPVLIINGVYHDCTVIHKCLHGASVY